MTGGTSSGSLLSARGPSDKKLVAPQLSKTEKHEVARYKGLKVESYDCMMLRCRRRCGVAWIMLTAVSGHDIV